MRRFMRNRRRMPTIRQCGMIGGNLRRSISATVTSPTRMSMTKDDMDVHDTRMDLSRRDFSSVDFSRVLHDKEALAGYCNQLPKDPYSYARYRAHSWISEDDHGRFMRIPYAPIAQSAHYNKDASMGDVIRTYEEIDDKYLMRGDIQYVFRHFAKSFGLGKHEPIMLHLSQTQVPANESTSNDDSLAASADPLAGQGFHNDGCEGIGIVVIQKDNCVGGENYLSYQRGSELDDPMSHILFRGVLDVGEALFVNDLEATHSASPIQAADPTQPARRTIMSMTTRFEDELQVVELLKANPKALVIQGRQRRNSHALRRFVDVSEQYE